MEREEAIKCIRDFMGQLTEGCQEALKSAIPELAESEDERIRKEIISALKFANDDGVYDKHIAYLEKQEDASKAIEAVDRIDKYIDEHLANAHDMKDSNPDKQYYRGWDDALGKMAGILQDVYSGENQKEQKPVDLSEMMVHKEPYIAPVPTPMVADEQKPAEWSEEDEIMLKWIEDILLIADDDLNDKLNGKVSPITDSAYSSMKKCIAKCRSWLKSLPLNLKKKNEDVAKLCSNEWSEEDAKKAAEDYADEFPGMTHENDGSTIEDYDKPYNDFLAGVLWAKHHGIFQNGNTHWKPSEEQMEALKDAVRLFKENHFEKFHYKIESLYEQLKKLM